MNAHVPKLLAASALITLGACGDSTEPPAENAQERQDLLTSVTDNVILPAYQRLVDNTAALATAAQAYASAVQTGEGLAEREAVQTAFTNAYSAMQYAELLQIGPYGPASKFEGGLNIRDEMYSWPVVNACRVDQEIVSEDFTGEDFFENSLVNVYGFDALEYLLFYDSAENSCPQPVSINTDGSWAALSTDMLRQRRAAYAARVAAQLALEADRLQDSWTNGFAEELRRAGSGSGTYRSTQAGLDAVFASMFY
ncbi:MAG: imelysin family protein, partial [Myxococcota bacterium]